MPHVRSVSIGVWLTRGSRHEPDEQSGIAHFVEHMLFKGTATRSAEDIAQAIDSIGGQLDAFTAKEYASYYIKVLDEHLPLAVDILSDIVLQPGVQRRRHRAREEGRPRRDQDGRGHARRPRPRAVHAELLGRPSARPADPRHPGDRRSRSTPTALREYFSGAYTAPNLIVAAVGNLEHAQVRDLVMQAFGGCPTVERSAERAPPTRRAAVLIRNKELEQSHSASARAAIRRTTTTATSSYVLNTMLGGSMSSRLFQNVREKRGLAYAVFSGLSAYRDAGSFTIYAGCANDAVGEVIDLVVEELRGVKHEPVPRRELRRAKDHLKGSLMLSLENTSSRMSHLARQEIYFDRQFGLDETLRGHRARDAGRRAAGGAAICSRTDRWRAHGARAGQRTADSAENDWSSD